MKDQNAATESLFPELVPLVLPDAEPVEKLSADRRRTLRQRQFVAAGIHPLTRQRHVGLEDGRTCGGCRFREIDQHHNRSYPKCYFGDGHRVSHSAASDVRAWWPACTDFEPAPAGLPQGGAA